MRKIICDLCKKETPTVVGQLAIGKVDIEGKAVDIIEICPDCRKKMIDTFSIKEYVEEPKEEAKE